MFEPLLTDPHAEGLDGIFTDTEEMRVISLLGEISLQDATQLMGRI